MPFKKSHAGCGLVGVLFLAAAACSPESVGETQLATEAPATTTSQPTEAASDLAVTIVDPWVAATPKGARVGAGYLIIKNTATSADRLVAASSARAKRVEIHEMRMDGDIMQMRVVEGVDVAGQGVMALAPGGYHLMFIEIDAPLLEGETAKVALTFANAGVIEIVMPVRDRAKMSPGARDGGGHHGH